MDRPHKAASTLSMPAPSSQVESITKRNKSSRACKECRRKKIKCNGENPCDRCQRAGQTCVFDAIFTSKRATQHNSWSSPPYSIISTKVDKENQCYKASLLSHEYQLGDDSAISVNAAGRPFYFPDWTRQPNAPITTATNWDTTLINMYFDSIHPLLPILHRATFHVQLQQGKIPKLLLNAMYGVICLCYQSTDLQQHLSWGLTCYESAFSLLDESLDMPRLSTVQALLLMVKFQEHARPPGHQFRIQQLIDTAYRTCQNLKLSQRWHQDPVHAEVGIRVFGAVYAYTILFSIEQGTSPPIHDIDLPSLLPDEHQQPIDAESITNFCTQCQITQLQGKIASFLRVKYGKESDEEMTLDEESKLHKHLTECLDQIQQRHSNIIHTTAKSNIHEKTPMVMAHNARWLQISLHFTTILLHRPYAANDLKAREKCVVAASTLCQLVDDVIKSTGNEWVAFFGVPRGLQQLIHYMAASITIHRLVQSCEGKKKKQGKVSSTPSKQVDKALDVIHTILRLHNQNIAIDGQAPQISQQHSHYRYSAPSIMQQYSTTSMSGSQQQQQSCTFDAINALPPATTRWLPSAKPSKVVNPHTSTMQQYDEMLLAKSTLGDHDADPMLIDKQQHSILDFK